MKDINYYLNLKYPIEVIETDDGFVSSHPDLPGCASFGDTAAEAIESLNEVRELWLKGQVEANGTAPEPRLPEEFSGKFVVRLPKWLHRVLDREAQRQECSLNTLVVSMLSASVGAQSRKSELVSSVAEDIAVALDFWEADYPSAGTWSFMDVPSEKRRSDYLKHWRFLAKGYEGSLTGSVVKKRTKLEEFEGFADVSKVKTKTAN